MKFANRIEKLPPYLFVGISQAIARKRAEGADVISFGIGDPDIPTPSHIMERLWEAAQVPANHRYPETYGLPECRRAIAHWYQKRFGVSLEPDTQVLPLIGAKEGIGHVALCFLDPGDVALVPDPGYPVYAAGTLFAGGESYWMPLTEENGWLPDLDAIPPAVARQAKVMWVNYPNNPTSAIAGLDFFEKVVEFARRHDIIVLHDAAYSEVAYDGHRPNSFLQVEGAIEVGMEFHSLSKTYNMTGWRIGMAVGNAEMIDALMRVKSNLDSGVPQAIQMAAIEALTGPQDYLIERNAIYQGRRDKMIETLTGLGLWVQPCKASLYVWARLPEGYTSGEFAKLLLEEKDIVVTPGAGYGRYGEGYIRLSLTTPDDQLERGLARLASWKIPPPTTAGR